MSYIEKSPKNQLSRRALLKALGIGAAASAFGTTRPLSASTKPGASPTKAPNVLYIFSDQQQNRAWEKNNPLIKTPHTMKLADEGAVLQNMVSQTPICTPYRAMLMSGQYPRTTGVLHNDQELLANGSRLSEVTKANGYRNAYIGKWHLSGARRDPNREKQIVTAPYRHGFSETWKGHEARHNYRPGGGAVAWNDENNQQVNLTKYRDIQEADEVIRFLDDHAINHSNDPFFAVWSLGPPHDPYLQFNNAQAAPNYKYYREQLNDPANLPPNYKKDGPINLDSLAGYYTMCSGIDTALGRVLNRLDALGLKEDTIVIFTSDHGDMMGSHGLMLKQKPWEESINVPFVIRYPGVIPAGVTNDLLIGSVDLMPTLLGLMGLSEEIPNSIEGLDLSKALLGLPNAPKREHVWIGATELTGPGPARPAAPYTGVRTKTHTYASFASGQVVPGYGRSGGYILHDNINDPWQLRNQVDQPQVKNLQAELRDRLISLNIEANESNFTLPV